jgi:hypothetical protein
MFRSYDHLQAEIFVILRELFHVFKIKKNEIQLLKNDLLEICISEEA